MKSCPCLRESTKGSRQSLPLSLAAHAGRGLCGGSGAGLSRAGWARAVRDEGYAEAVRRRVFARFAISAGATWVGQVHIDALAGLVRTGMRADLPGVSIVNDNGVLRRWENPASAFCVPFRFDGVTEDPAGRMRQVCGTPRPRMRRRRLLSNILDLDKLLARAGRGDPCAQPPRGRQNRPSGRRHAQAQGGLYRQEDSEDRRGAVALVAAGGEVLWAAGVCGLVRNCRGFFDKARSLCSIQAIWNFGRRLT